MGPYPEQRDLYVERSPITHIDGFKAPIIFFQVWATRAAIAAC